MIPRYYGRRESKTALAAKGLGLLATAAAGRFSKPLLPAVPAFPSLPGFGAVRRPRSRAGPYNRKKMMPGGFPNSQFVRFKYCDSIVIDPAAGGTAVYVFRANDIDHPDFTAAGHKPYGFDQMMIGYDHFTVIGSKIRVRQVPVAAVNAIPGVVSIALTDNGTKFAALSIGAILESNLTRNWTITGFMNASGPGRPSAVTQKFSAKKFFGVKNVVGQSQYRGADGVSPAEGAFYEVVMTSPNLANNPDPARFIVEIEYAVVLTEPKLLAESLQ